ncbi:MAG TPA: hypothetical protein VGB71_08870 [Flavisolibacter sp.]|jgi:hypothetical protein
MAFSTTIQHVEKPVDIQVQTQTPNDELSDALFGMVLLSVYGAQMSKKTVRKMKRQFFWTSLKLKAKSLFSKKQVSDRTLIYILLGVALIALIVLAPVAALVLAVLALVLILAGVI